MAAYNYNYRCFGDFDNDKKLSSMDIVLMRKSILGLFDENYDEIVANINQDGNFDILDFIYIKNKLCGAKV